MSISTIATILGEIVAIVGFFVPVFVRIKKISDGQKCQLRSEILHIYYSNREAREIRQYEYENFVFLYEAYKALKGNSFIDKINEDIKTWEVIS